MNTPTNPPPMTPEQVQRLRQMQGQRHARDASGVLPSAGQRTPEQQATRLGELRQRSDLRRAASEVGSVDREARTVDLAFSSQAEVKRWFGVEVLSHEPGAMRMGRLADGAALLWNHDWDQQVGVVQSARVDGDLKGRATVRFSRSALGEEKLADVADGITRHVSVGYRIHDARLIEVRDGGDEVWLITDWEPYEISLVTVPADVDVGVGRSAAEITQEEQQREPAETGTVRSANGGNHQPTGGHRAMKTKNVRRADGALVRCEVDDAGNVVRELEVIQTAEEARAERNAGGEAERTRVRALSEMGNQFRASIPTADDLVRTAITEGHTPEQLQRAMLDAAVQGGGTRSLGEQSRASDIGMTDAEVGRFSLLRAVRALVNPQDQALQRAAAFEFEASRAAAERYGRDARGLLIPSDVLGRAFNAGQNAQATGQTGGNLVATELLAGSFVEMLRNRTTAMRLGTVMAGLVGKVDIPKQTGGATAYWVGEGEDATEGVPTIGQFGLTPKTVAAYTDITRRLLQQSTPDAEAIVRRDLQNALGQAIDKAAYYGSGTGDEPKGIKNYTGLNGVDFAALWPTFAELVAMESEVAADNADINNMAYVANAKFRGHCKTTAKFGAGTEATIWEQGGTVNGYRTEVTNQVTDGDVFHGNFADLLIGLWGGLDLVVDTASLSKSGGLRLVVFQDVDIALRRVESLCYGSQTVTP